MTAITRPSFRFLNSLRRLVLRMRISAAERDVQYFDREAMRTSNPVHALHFRNQASQWRRDVQAMRVDLMILES